MLHRMVALFRLARVGFVKDDGPIQLLQAVEGDLGAYGGQVVSEQLPHVGEFGLASSPPIGANLLLAGPAGRRSQSLVLGTNHQESRPRDLGPGDAALYDVRGARVWLTATGVVIDAAGGSVRIVNVPAGVSVEGSLSTDENLVAGNGATGSFTTPTGDTVTVQDGIITNID